MILLAFAAWTQEPLETPRAFVARVYAGYRNSDFSPFKHPEHWFAPRLLWAIEEDSRLARGEVGYLDGDPICQCQDAAGLRATIVRVAPRGRDQAQVRVSIRLHGYKPRPARLSLVRTRVGWRIADVVGSDGGSLLRGLEASNRKLQQ